MEKKSGLEVITDTYFPGMSDKTLSVVYLLNSSKKEEQLSASDIVLRILGAYKAYLNNKDIQDEIPFSSVTNLNEFCLSAQGKHKLTIKTANDQNQEGEDLWEINITGDFFTVEHFRECVLNELRNTKYSCYCLIDQVSAEINKRAYPLINELENLVREYLMRFFIMKVGSNWWNYNSSEGLKKKTQGTARSMNGIKGEIYSIDFVDLKELITGCFPRLSNSDIVQSLDGICTSANDPIKVQEKVDRLKQNFLGNWEKFFHDQMQIDDFKSVWDRLYDIRCMVCHNSLITLKCFLDLIKNYEDLKPKFIKIIANTEVTPLSSAEKEAIIKNEKIAERLRAIEKLPIKFVDDDVQELIKNNTLNLTSQNLESTKEYTVDEFKMEIEASVLPSLSPIGEIEDYVIQGEDSGIPSCWIKFKPLQDEVLVTLNKI